MVQLNAASRCDLFRVKYSQAFQGHLPSDRVGHDVRIGCRNPVPAGLVAYRQFGVLHPQQCRLLLRRADRVAINRVPLGAGGRVDPVVDDHLKTAGAFEDHGDVAQDQVLKLTAAVAENRDCC